MFVLVESPERRGVMPAPLNSFPAMNPVLGIRHECLATSFADPADVSAFRLATARGLSDREAFAIGDNGVGCWGDDTTASRPMVALPPEDWIALPVPRGAPVCVEFNGRVITAELRDRMPKKANIRNGAGIDLNPAAAAALDLVPPFKVPVAWWFPESPASARDRALAKPRRPWPLELLVLFKEQVLKWY